MSEFDDEDLLDELRSRGITYDAESDISRMFEAFYIGDDEKAMQIAREVASSHTGRMLP